MPDARCTRGLMRNVHRKCAHEHTGQRRTSDIPCAMALRLITCSPRRTALLPPSRPGKSDVSQVHGRQRRGVGTTRLCRTPQPRPSSDNLGVHRDPSLVVTMANAPLGGTGWLKVCR